MKSRFMGNTFMIRPLAIQKDGTWFTYGYDLTKNVCEVFGPAGYIRTSYSYAPFGNVSASGDVTQPFQWSSEHYDSELDLVYYNYRHYSPSLGRFLSRDPISEFGALNLYSYVGNRSIQLTDQLGLVADKIFDEIEKIVQNETAKLIENWEAKLEKEAKKLIDRGFRKALKDFGEPNIDYSGVTLFPVQQSGTPTQEGFVLSISGYATGPTLVSPGINDKRYSVRATKKWTVSRGGISSVKTFKISDTPKICGWEVKFAIAITENSEVNISYNGKTSYDSFNDRLEQDVTFVFKATF